MKRLSSKELSDFCLEARLFLNAGIEIGEGLDLLCAGQHSKSTKALFDFFCGSAGCDLPLSDRLEASGLFPRYFIETVRLGEASDKLDEVLSNLSIYYKKKAGLSNALYGAVFYPILLFAAMSTVLIILVTQVLPIFNEIYAQLGAQMSSLAVSLFYAGRWLTAAQTVILAALAVFLIIGIAVYLISPVRRTVSRGFDARFGGKGLLGQVSSAKLASAMSVAVSSGLEPVRALELAGSTCQNSGSMRRRLKRCREHIECGESLEECLSKARIFSLRESRLISMSNATGSAGDAMKEIARHSGEKVSLELDARLRRLGSAMLIAVCIIVGLTLFSVLLPIIGILSSLS